MADDQQQPDQVTALAHQLFNDPKTRPLIEQGIATLYPDRAAAAVPAYQMRQEVQAEIKALRDENEKIKTERATEKLAETNAAQALAWRRGAVAAGAKVEELPKIEELANKKLIGHPEVAVREFRHEQQLADPSPARFGAMLPGPKAGEFFKDLTPGNEDRWARERAARDIAAIRAGRPLDPSPLG